MKVEIEIPDLEEIYYSCDEEGVTPKDFKEAIVNVAIEKFIDKMYDNYVNDKVYSTIKDDAKEIVNSIENNQFDLDRVEGFRDKYIELNEGKCTSNLVDFIFKFM